MNVAMKDTFHQSARRRRPAGRRQAGRRPAGRRPADRGLADRRPADRRPADRSAGFTILEVLIAMLLFAIMMVGMAAMQVTVLRTSATSRQTTMATQLAQSRLEDYRILPFAAILPTATVAEAWFNYANEPVVTGAPDSYFTRQLTIANPPAVICGQPMSVPGPGIVAIGIQVDVVWTDSSGAQTVSLCMERSSP